jgi:hypothetical protein
MTTAAAPKLLSTRDYDKFELNPQNRDTEPDKLRKSMERYGFLPQYPLHCVPNGTKLKIKAGHHRFAVARELGIPVYYVLADDGDIGIHELEAATKPWSLADYLTSYVREGRGYYVEVKQFWTRTDLPLGCCIGMLAGELAASHNKYPGFKAGNYRVTPAGRQHAEAVARLVAAAKEAGSAFATTTPFVQAASRVVIVEEVDLTELERRLGKWNHLLERQRSIRDYVLSLEQVYNHASKERRLPLAFLSDAAARARSAV